MLRVGLKLQGVRDSKFMAEMFLQMRQLCARSRHLGSSNGLLTRASIKDLVRNNHKLQREHGSGGGSAGGVASRTSASVDLNLTRGSEAPRSSGKDRFRASIRKEKGGSEPGTGAGGGGTEIEPREILVPELPVVSIAVVEGRHLLAANVQDDDSDAICVCRMGPYEYEAAAAAAVANHEGGDEGVSFASTVVSKTIAPRWHFKCSFPLSGLSGGGGGAEHAVGGIPPAFVTAEQHQQAADAAIAKIKDAAVHLYVRDEDLLDLSGTSKQVGDVARLERCHRGMAAGNLSQEPDAIYTPLGVLRIPLRTVIAKGTVRKYRSEADPPKIGGSGDTAAAAATSYLSVQMPPTWFELEMETSLGMRFVKGSIRVGVRIAGLQDSPAMRDAIIDAKKGDGLSQIKGMTALY